MSQLTQPHIEVTDKGFDPGLVEEYRLSILFGQDGFSFCVFDRQRSKCIALEHHEITKSGQASRFSLDEQAIKAFTSFALRHKYLHLGFLDVIIMPESRLSTLVPSSIHQPSKNKVFLQHAFSIPDAYDIVENRLRSMDAFLVYAFPSNWAEQSKILYPKASIIHPSAVFIDSLITHNRNLEMNDTIYVDVHASWLETACFTERKLVHHNTFQYHSNEDFLYFLLFTMEQLDLNPEKSTVMLSGSFDKSSGLAFLLAKYIRNIEYAQRPDNFGYSYVFDQISKHQYFTLLNAQLCE
ncbi:MAG: DUF3822 family protein [Bacteroidales bacterium]|nr:DUF3822 family protein [Bacteroidales bacterium]